MRFEFLISILLDLKWINIDMRELYEDLSELQIAYDQVNESFFEDGMTYQGYLKRCKERNISPDCIMNEDEFDAMMSGDWEDDKEDEDPYQSRMYFKEEDAEDFLEPKSKMTEDEAMQWFQSDDMFHQLFHKFMEKQHYHEKEINGKQFWCKS